MFSEYLAFSMFQLVYQQPMVDIRIYYPETYDLNAPTPHPVLYMLAPFRGDALYYFNHGLSMMADKMIREGTIEPMIIVCVDGTHGYGATFYADSWSGGNYTDLLGEKTGVFVDGSLIDYIDNVFLTKTDRSQRAISGFGLGGYGAMRVAIEHSENFGAVSAVSGPLDFDGASGNGGFISLFPTVIQNLAEDGFTYKEMRATVERPLRTMLMGAACSFSPHVEYVNPISFANIGIYDPVAEDTIVFDDTLSLFRPEGTSSRIAFHMPFDASGIINDTPIPTEFFDTIWTFDTTIVLPDTIVDTSFVVDSIYDTVGYYDSVWGMWLEDNLENILPMHPGSMDTTEIKFYNVADDIFGFDQQTRDFAAYLQNYLAGRGVTRDLTPFEYQGYDNYDATVGHMVYNILPELLKYHSNLFSGQ
jgi:hypothetical protein